MKPVADAKKPSSGSNLTNGVAPAPTGCITKSNMFFSLLPAACCAFMLYSSVTAIVDSHGDPSTVFFVVSSLSILGLLYLSMREFERAVAVKDDQKRDRPLKMAIWSLAAVLLNILFSYRVTDVLQSPVMTGIIWGIAAVTSLVGIYLLLFTPAPPPTSSSREGAAHWILGVFITGLGFIAATAESVRLPMETSNASDINPQGSEISSSSLYRDILTVFFLCGCSVSLLRVSSLAILEFQRAIITKDLLRSNFLKITILSLPMLLTSLCAYRASSLLQVGLMTAGAWIIAVLSWSRELAVTTGPPPDTGLPAPPPSADKIQPPSTSDPEGGKL